MKNVGNPIVAGNVIFFTQTHINKEKNTYETGIYSVHKETGEVKQWGDGSESNTSIALSPNKKILTFLSSKTKNNKPQLFFMSVNGGVAQQVTEEEEGVHSYIWSVDGEYVYYHTKEKKVKVEEEIDTTVFPQPNIFTKITTKADGVGLIQHTHHTVVKQLAISKKEGTEYFRFEQPATVQYVSKNGEIIVYSQSLTVQDELLYGKNTVYIKNTQTNETKDVLNLTSNRTAYFLSMNPTEEYMLILGNDFSKGFVTQSDIYVLNMNTFETRVVTEDVDMAIGDLLVADFQQQISGVPIEWLDDENFIFSVTEQGKVVLCKGNIFAGVEKVLDDFLHVTGSALFENKKQIAITYSTLTIPSRLALFDLQTKELIDVYNPNAVAEPQYVFSTPERFWYKGYDNWDVQGWYVPPIEKSSKHAAILYVHGGPQVAYGESFFHEMQVLSGLGYGVILLNPRGGNSYGQEFVASILGAYGSHDFDDLMLGVDAVLERYPEIDVDSIYVTGGSYGGFMTNWIVTHTNRFKAAVTQRSISNWISFYGVSDIGPFFVEYQLLADVTTGMESLWKMSPLAYAQQVETPLLILHGEEDKRCPQEQAEQFYTVLKRLRKEVKLITFPRSSHGLSRNGLPNLRIKRLEAIQEWFEQHK